MLWGLRLPTAQPPKRVYHSFTQEKVTGHLLCARTMLGAGDTGVSGTEEVPVLGGEGRKAIGRRTSKKISRDLPGRPLVRTPRFQCRGYGFDPWSGN